MVVPVTAQPLVLRCQVLGIRPSGRPSCVLYAAKFLDLCNDEETMLREAVFNLQLRGRPRAAGRPLEIADIVANINIVIEPVPGTHVGKRHSVQLVGVCRGRAGKERSHS